MHFELFKSHKQFRWRLRAKNGKIIANAGERYRRRKDCLDAIGLVMSVNQGTPIQDLTKGAYK